MATSDCHSPDRRRGRPSGSRIPERRSSVSTWLPVSMHDRLIALANKHDVSVSTLVKRLVIQQLGKS